MAWLGLLGLALLALSMGPTWAQRQGKQVQAEPHHFVPDFDMHKSNFKHLIPNVGTWAQPALILNVRFE